MFLIDAPAGTEFFVYFVEWQPGRVMRPPDR